ncbi:MAG TPA: DUF5667 domain-containing protein [Patescibacteria group bacterium]
MSYTLRFILSAGALLVGCSILGISLFYGSVQSFSASGKVESFEKEFYFDQEMLPDHVLYPMLMVVDRVRLESAPELEQIYLQAEYANRRLEYTEELIAKEKIELAYSTLTKSEKYLLQAAQNTVNSPERTDNTVSHLIKTIEYHQAKHKELAPHFSDPQRAQIDAFLQQAQVVLEQLKSL